MTRGLPLGIMFLLFAWMAVNVSTTFMWIFTAVCVILLIVLICAMYWRDQYVSPKTLIEDVRIVGRKLTRDRGGEAERSESSASQSVVGDLPASDTHEHHSEREGER